MSGRKHRAAKSAEKKINKYASKYVGEILDELIMQRLTTVACPKVTAKWLAKMKASVQKKISIQSKSLFQPPENSKAVLLADIAALQDKIKIQTNNIKQKAIIRQNEVTIYGQPPTSTPPVYTQGQFETFTGLIGEHYQCLAKTIGETTKELDTRTQSLSVSLSTVKEHLPHVLELLQQRNESTVSGTDGSKNSSKVTTGKGRKPATDTGRNGDVRSTRNEPLQALSAHLGNK